MAENERESETITSADIATVSASHLIPQDETTQRDESQRTSDIEGVNAEVTGEEAPDKAKE